MTQSKRCQDELAAQARIAKARTWTNQEQQSKVQVLLPIINRLDINETQKELSSVKLKYEEDRAELKVHWDRCNTIEKVLSNLQQTLAEEDRKFNTQQFEQFSSRCEDLEKALNTYQNRSHGFEAKLEAELKSFEARLETAESSVLENPLVSPQQAEILDFFTERKNDVASLLKLFDAPEKLSHLRVFLENFKQNKVGVSDHSEAHVTTIPTNTAPAIVTSEMLVEVSTAPSEENLDSPPRSLLKFTRNWDHFRTQYAVKPPKNRFCEASFIRSFLQAHKPRVADVLQKTILHYCQAARQRSIPVRAGRYNAMIYIDTNTFSWHDLEAALDNLDYKTLNPILEFEERQYSLQKRRRAMHRKPNTDHLEESSNTVENSVWHGEGESEL